MWQTRHNEDKQTRPEGLDAMHNKLARLDIVLSKGGIKAEHHRPTRSFRGHILFGNIEPVLELEVCTISCRENVKGLERAGRFLRQHWRKFVRALCTNKHINITSCAQAVTDSFRTNTIQLHDLQSKHMPNTLAQTYHEHESMVTLCRERGVGREGRGLEKGRGRRRGRDRRKVEKVVSWKDELFSGEKLAHVAHNAHLRFACVSVAHLAHNVFLPTSCSYVKRIKLLRGRAHTWCINALYQHGTHDRSQFPRQGPQARNFCVWQAAM